MRQCVGIASIAFNYGIVAHEQAEEHFVECLWFKLRERVMNSGHQLLNVPA